MQPAPLDDGSRPVNADGKNLGDSGVSQNIKDVRAKAAQTLNKDGTPRKPYKKRGVASSDALPAANQTGSGSAGFTNPQIRATFQGLFSMAALSTNCNVWFLADAEADVFVPSATLAFNQSFPSVAQSKWGALTLASLSLSAIVVAKTLSYMQYKQSIKQKPVEQKPMDDAA